MSLDRKADDYTQDIFGAGDYAIIDHIEKLPKKLPGKLPGKSPEKRLLLFTSTYIVIKLYE